MHQGSRNRRQQSPNTTGLAWALACIILLPAAAAGQSLDDTVQFISDMANTHGFVRSLSCRNPKAGKPTKITEIYSVIPTGTKLGTSRTQSRT
jgi:hypothetical protein